MATKKKKNFVKLICGTCKNINYYTNKSQEAITSGKKLSLKKFCKFCRKHTAHKEIKK